MGMLEGIFGNKMLVNMAMSRFKEFMSTEGITAIVLQLDPAATETDGVKFDKVKGEVLIVTGEDVARVAKKISMYDQFMPPGLLASDWLKIGEFAHDLVDEREKEVSNGA